MKSSLKYFDRNTIFSGLFFFFVLFSLFIMRPFRGAITAQIGTADLTYFLFIVVLVMFVFKSPALRLVSIEQLVKGRIMMIIGKKIIYHFIKANLFPSATLTKTNNPDNIT